MDKGGNVITVSMGCGNSWAATGCGVMLSESATAWLVLQLLGEAAMSLVSASATAQLPSRAVSSTR